MGPRNRGGRPSLTAGLDREVSYAIEWGEEKNGVVDSCGDMY